VEIPKPKRTTPKEEARLRALEAKVAEVARKDPTGIFFGRDPIDAVVMKEKDRRELRRRRYALEQEHRQWVEAEIERGVDPDELGLWTPRRSPDEAFLVERLCQMPKGADPEQNIKSVLLELLRTDIPLGALVRAQMVSVFSPDRPDRKAIRRIAAADKMLRDHLIGLGMMAKDADMAVAESQNVTVSALKQRRRRSKK
jgi:hypothetical protein